MLKFSFVRLNSLFSVCIFILTLASCSKSVVVDSKPAVYKATQDIKIPYDDIKPVMPDIPKDIGTLAVIGKYGEDEGYGLTAEDTKACLLDSKSKFVIVHHFEDNSESPVVIENIDGTRTIASKECTVVFNATSMGLSEPILSLSIKGVSKLNKYQSISDFAVNPKVRFIQITTDKGGQWNQEQVRAFYSKYNK